MIRVIGNSFCLKGLKKNKMFNITAHFMLLAFEVSNDL